MHSILELTGLTPNSMLQQQATTKGIAVCNHVVLHVSDLNETNKGEQL